MTTGLDQALVVTRPGGVDVLEVEPLVLPPPGPHEVSVRVGASGINFKDVYEREGRYPITTPFVLGDEGAGEVTAVGADVTAFARGDLVAWATGRGSHASAVNVDATQVVPVPDGVSAELAAAVMLQGMTAHYLLNSTYPVQPGDAIVVHAAAGGVGQLLVQFARALGARVIGTAGSDEKCDKALALGAEAVLRYDQFDDSAALAAAIRDANAGAGVSAVYDGVGEATFEASLASLAVRGTLVLYGASSGPVPPFDLQRLNRGGSLFVTRPTLAHYLRTRDELLLRAGAVLNAVADGSLQVEIGARYSLTNAGAAYTALESRATTGKVLFVP